MTKQREAKVKPAKEQLQAKMPLAHELSGDQASLNEPPGGVASVGIEAQAGRLGDNRLQRAQQQALANQIGQMGGNRQLQRTIALLQRGKQATITRQPQPIQADVIQRALTFDEAKKKIKKASKGWGTDEGGIYAAIRGCSAADRAKLKADSDVQSLLKSEMSGHDLWKAQLLLEYGSESSFPPAIKEIWGATKGWGTDEARIYKALQKLSATDVARISKVPGLRKMLKGELSGKDLQAANKLLSGDYAKALAKHKANVAFVKSELRAMKTSANLLERNTAEWLAPSRRGVSPKNDLYVLTPTHDSAARGKEHGKDPNVAYFGDSPKYPSDSADYDAHIKSKRNIHFSGPSILGEHRGKNIWVHDPKGKGSATFRVVVTHEVQHDADRHDRELGYEQAFKSPEESWNRYKTEFRAYWIAGYHTVNMASGTATAPWDNARQKAIFDHLYGSSPTDTYAKWLRPSYDNNATVYGQKFKDLVHAYTRPEGVNLLNSPRIDDLFLQLEKCKPSHTNLTASPLKELEAAAKALDANDRNHVNSSAATRLQETMKDHLAPAVLARIATIVNGGTAPAWINVNIASARRDIIEAGKGWGTDEQKIYDTIAKASPAERAAMKTDPHIRKALFAELSGHDLWKAQLMIEFGAQQNWPQTIQDLWKATKGAGTNEALIRSALEKLTRPQAEAIARVEGLRDMLSDELSGEDWTAVKELLGGKYADAIANHQKDMQAIAALIQAGLTSADVNWKAICVKLNDPGKAFIHAMTPTHNSIARVKHAKQSGKTAYFGADTQYPSTASHYDSLPSNNHGIRFVNSSTKSETLGKNLYVYEARNIAGNLRTILENFGRTL